MGIYSVLNYAINGGENQNPDNIVVEQRTGLVLQQMLRTNYDDALQIKHSAIAPFRLTRNLVEMMQPFGLQGPYTSAVCATAMCLGKSKMQLANYLELFLRDDLEIHQTRLQHRVSPSKSPVKVEAPLSREALKPKVIANAAVVMSRLRGLSPQPDDEGNSVDSCIGRVEQLISSARDSVLLSKMPPSWQAWL